MTRQPFASIFASRWIPVAVLGIGLACTAVAAVQLATANRDRDRQRFEVAARRVEAAVGQRAAAGLSLLRSTTGLLARESGYTNPPEFQKFLAAVRVADHPGVRTVGYSRRVLERELKDFAAEARRRYDPAFELTPAPEPGRREYQTVVLLDAAVPGDRRAMGFDMSTDPGCRAAMDRARDTGEAAASAPMTPAWDGGGGTGPPVMLVYAPIYKKAARATDAGSRREALVGFAFAVVQPGSLCDVASAVATPGAAAAAATDAEFAIRDDAAGGAAGLLHRTPGYEAAVSRPARHSTAFPVTVAGRAWTLDTRSTPAFEAATEASLVTAVVAGGATVSLVLAGLTWLQVRARAAAAAARRQAEALREQAEASRAQAEAALARAERAARVKDEFLATLSHELRTPLNAILGWAQLLRRQPAGRPAGPTVDEGLDVIERNARAQARLVSDLLDVSRVVAGKVRLAVRPVDLAAVAAAAVDSARPAAAARRVALELDAGPGSLAVAGDADRLQQVAWNLLSNAVKFTPAGGRVRVTVDRAGGHVALAVADTGEGIDPAFLPHLFDPFSQAEAGAARRHGGLGLGLAIVRHLVDLHGGRVAAASGGRGAGATFTVELPAADPRPAEDAAAGDAAARPDHAPADARPLAGLTVLAVEDEPDARELVRRVLAGAGADVVVAAGADEAVVLLGDRRPDVMVADIGMPGRDGLALVRAVRALPAGAGGSTPAVALTAFAGPEDRQRALAAGYQLHLPKPADAAALVAAVAGVAGRGPPGDMTAGPAVASPATAPREATRRERLGLDG